MREDDAAAADSPRTPSLIVGISSSFSPTCPSADTTSVTPQPLAGDDSAAEGVGAGIIPTDKGMQAGVVCSELAVLSALVTLQRALLKAQCAFRS